MPHKVQNHIVQTKNMFAVYMVDTSSSVHIFLNFFPARPFILQL